MTATTLHHGSRRALATVLLSAAVTLGAAGTAGAQATATVTPAQAGAPAKIHWQLDGAAAPVSKQIPTSLVMAAPGFVMDPTAVAKRCTVTQSKLDECPKGSRLGSAVLTIRVFKPMGTNDLPIPVELYLGKNNSLLAVGFLAGVRVIPGSISGVNGITVTFDPLPAPPPIAQVRYEFVGVTADIGAHRTIIVGEKSCKKGKKGKKCRARNKKRPRKVVDLVTNPAQCAGAWPLTMTAGLPDGTKPVLATPVACTAGTR